MRYKVFHKMDCTDEKKEKRGSILQIIIEPGQPPKAVIAWGWRQEVTVELLSDLIGAEAEWR